VLLIDVHTVNRFLEIRNLLEDMTNEKYTNFKFLNLNQLDYWYEDIEMSRLLLKWETTNQMMCPYLL